MALHSFELMDQLDWPVLLVDEQNSPLFLSSNGAQLLQIQHRDRLQDYQPQLAPLLSLASDSGRSLQAQLGNSPTRIHDLTLTAANGRIFPGVGFAKKLEQAQPTAELSAASAVMFYDVSQLEPVYKIISNSRINRSYLIHCAATYGASFNYHHDPLGTASASKPREKSAAAVDLLELITSAVEIVDPLLMTTVKLNVDVRTSALLGVDQVQATKLLAHLLVEAGDFLGAGGKIKLRAVLKYLSPERAKKRQQKETRFSELVLLATRTANAPQTPHPIEAHLFRHSFPRHYRVMVDDSAAGSWDNAATANNNSLLPEGTKTSFGENSLVSEDAFSDNLRMANHIANHAKLPFQVRRLRADMLAIYLPLPLSQVQAITR